MTHYKYPRTPHLPWSPGAANDDVRLIDTRCFTGKNVIVTEKMDGENTSLYADHMHARSLDSRHHPSRDWVKQLHARIAHQIPPAWRICGENVYAKHAIAYEQLPSYFFVFSLWDNQNRCLSWPETLEWAERLALQTPRIFYQGVWDEKRLQSLSFDTDKIEGYVVRLSAAFPFADFPNAVAKWVRSQHVQNNQHWMHSPITPNRLTKKPVHKHA